MSLPNIELPALELEELAETEPAVAPALIRFQSGEDWFLLRQCKSRYNDPILILCLDVLEAPLVRTHWPSSAASLRRALKQPETLLQQGKWRRKLRYEPASDELILRVWTETSQWTSPLNPDHGRWKFPHQITLDWLLRASDNEIRAQTQKLLQDPKSDCQFALNWLSLDEDERSSLALCARKGSYKELIQVLRWITLVHCSDLIGNDTHLNLYVDRREDEDYEYSDDDIKLFDEDWENLIPSVSAFICFKFACRYFRPAYRKDLAYYTAIQEELKGKPFRQFIYFSVPSHHERLEAQLLLRDFLRDKVSPAELCELMGE